MFGKGNHFKIPRPTGKFCPMGWLKQAILTYVTVQTPALPRAIQKFQQNEVNKKCQQMYSILMMYVSVVVLRPGLSLKIIFSRSQVSESWSWSQITVVLVLSQSRDLEVLELWVRPLKK